MSSAAKILSLFLLIQAGLFWGGSRSEVVPPTPVLKQIESSEPGWNKIYEGEVDADQQVVLKADATLIRVYQQQASPLRASLYIASFVSQRSGRAPHSPQNCLPGAGWTWKNRALRRFRSKAAANRLRSIVMSCRRAIARALSTTGINRATVQWPAKYWGKIYVVLDAIRLNRTDSSLVRVMVDVQNNDVEAADRAALDFMSKSYKNIRKQLPS